MWFELSVIFAFLAMGLGIWINKEKVNWHQYLGAVLALIASISLGISI